MSKILATAIALLLVTPLISCGGTATEVEVPRKAFEMRAKPSLPAPGFEIEQLPEYLVDVEEWMDAAIAKVSTMTEIICAQLICVEGQGAE